MHYSTFKKTVSQKLSEQYILYIERSIDILKVDFLHKKMDG